MHLKLILKDGFKINILGLTGRYRLNISRDPSTLGVNLEATDIRS